MKLEENRTIKQDDEAGKSAVLLLSLDTKRWTLSIQHSTLCSTLGTKHWALYTKPLKTWTLHTNPKPQTMTQARQRCSWSRSTRNTQATQHSTLNTHATLNTTHWALKTHATLNTKDSTMNTHATRNPKRWSRQGSSAPALARRARGPHGAAVSPTTKP